MVCKGIDLFLPSALLGMKRCWEFINLFSKCWLLVRVTSNKECQRICAKAGKSKRNPGGEESLEFLKIFYSQIMGDLRKSCKKQYRTFPHARRPASPVDALRHDEQRPRLGGYRWREAVAVVRLHPLLLLMFLLWSETKSGIPRCLSSRLFGVFPSGGSSLFPCASSLGAFHKYWPVIV